MSRIASRRVGFAVQSGHEVGAMTPVPNAQPLKGCPVYVMFLWNLAYPSARIKPDIPSIT